MGTFNEGDVVQLKSGGPKMTIQGIGKYGVAALSDNALCVWFDGPKPMEKVYEFVALQLAAPPQGRGVVSTGIDR